MAKEAIIPFAYLPNYQPGDTVSESRCGAVVGHYSSKGLLLNVKPNLNKCPGCPLSDHCSEKSTKDKSLEY